MVLSVITYKTGLSAPGAITVLVNHTYYYKSISGTGFGSESSAITATPSGGNGSYTYAWTVEDQSGLGHVYWSNETTASPTLNWEDLDLVGFQQEGVFRCTVTDTAGNTGYVNIGFTVIKTS